MTKLSSETVFWVLKYPPNNLQQLVYLSGKDFPILESSIAHFDGNLDLGHYLGNARSQKFLFGCGEMNYFCDLKLI